MSFSRELFPAWEHKKIVRTSIGKNQLTGILMTSIPTPPGDGCNKANIYFEITFAALLQTAFKGES